MTALESPTPPQLATTRGWRAWAIQHSELGFAFGVLALAVFLTVGTAVMEVPEGSGTPGPRFFPIIVTGFLYLQAALLTIDVLRHPPLPPHREAEVSRAMLEDLGGIDHQRTSSATETVDWRSVAMVLGSLVIFVLLLEPVGWLICAGALFWAISHALGSTRPQFDIVVSALVSATIQLAFSAGLGLNLPAGILEGVL
ncbi:tripartite tricarboxylate transporter TctB family protein [Aeromicrobium sp. CF3.5]|uniref:tripartite tricarboxylate transporter TctB family protein n=1 Tax=Aeromicrobium sp. CF3.5 TaxID=3373078 RepID=UPI003EE42C73